MANLDSREWSDNLSKMLVRLGFIKNLPTGGGVHIHVGCGPQVFPGFLNIDKYEKRPGIIAADMYQLPYAPDYADTIYSSHSLEHLPIRHGRAALANWGKILKPGGMLYLAIPDLEEIFKVIMDKSISLHNRENWFMYTLFGYQTDTNVRADDLRYDLPIDPGQFHQSGYTEETIRHYLKHAGFEVGTLLHYNGWGTPSMWVEAVKPNRK